MKTLLGVLFLFLAPHLYALRHEVCGRVLSLNNRPMPGVNVILQGTANGTATDMNGYFKILLPEGPVVLFFMYLKQKPLEHSFILRPGYQYEINAFLADKTQTFHKSYAITGELPEDALRITGRVVDQNNRFLYGVSISQKNNSFNTITDPEGLFILPVPTGENVFSFTYGGLKPLEVALDVQKGFTYVLEVVLVEDKNKHRARESSVKTIVNAAGN